MPAKQAIVRGRRRRAAPGCLVDVD